MSQERVQIIDFTHLIYKYRYGGAQGLHIMINVNGTPTRVDTSVTTGVVKQIHRWSRLGTNPTVVCFDSPGCNRSRKAYFAKENGMTLTGEIIGYKGDRASQDNSFYEVLNLTQNILRDGGVSYLKAYGYEADDLIKAAVDRAKIDYPSIPIDIITGDQDLVPLVDEQVSVFLYSKKLTWAESPEIEKRHYMQLRPYNLQEYMEGLTEFKGLQVPYNTVLLKKLLRGKKADSIPAYPKFTPTKYNNLINSLVSDGYDLSELCRYDAPVMIPIYKSTGLEIPSELVNSVSADDKDFLYKDPKKLTELCGVLSNYLDDDIINHVRFIYNGVNLNGAFSGLSDFDRRPARLSKPIRNYSASKLQESCNKLKIVLPYNV